MADEFRRWWDYIVFVPCYGECRGKGVWEGGGVLMGGVLERSCVGGLEWQSYFICSGNK